MNKVIWNKNNVEYFYSKREPYWLKDYFKIIIFNPDTQRNFEENINSFEVIDDKRLIIEGNFKIGDILEVDGIQYVCGNLNQDTSTQTEEPVHVDANVQTDEIEGEISSVLTEESSTQTEVETTSTGVGTDEILKETQDNSTQTETEEKKNSSEDNQSHGSYIGLNNEGKMLLGDDEAPENIVKDGNSQEADEHTPDHSDEHHNTKPVKEHSKKYLELSKMSGTKFSDLRIVAEESNIYALKSTNDEKHITIKIDEYTKEIYPEFPYNVIKKEFDLKNDCTLVHSVKKGTIIIFKISDGENELRIEYENTPLFHYSTVKSLKTKIKDFNLGLTEKDDESYKTLISQKSLYLKRRFGLTEKQTSNIEFFPLYQQLVDLYCILSMISYSFIQGKPLIDENGNIYHNSELKLGKFKADGDFDGGSIFAPEAIRKSIRQAEEDLSAALINEAYIIHHNNAYAMGELKHNPFICGAYLKERILSHTCSFNNTLKIKDIE